MPQRYIHSAQVSLTHIKADHSHKRLAIFLSIILTIVFIGAAPFAQVKLDPYPAFMPAYEASLLVIDLITAILLLGQFWQLRLTVLLILAAAYLFDATMVIPHALSFPGLITQTGWLGAGPQTTAWLYMFWHGGFPLFLIGYAWFQRYAPTAVIANRPGISLIIVCDGVIVISIIFTILAVHADQFLPEVMIGNGYTSILRYVTGTIWLFSFTAFVVLITKRPYSVIDIWLIVVMFAWMVDIALAAVLNAGRYDLGFYLGRFYGLLSASCIIGIMVVEMNGARNVISIINQRIFDTTLDLILVVDAFGTFIRVSPSCYEILGYPKDQMDGHNAKEFLYPPDLENTRNEMRIARYRHQTRKFECHYVHKKGHIVTLWWTGIWSEPEHQYFFIGRDITERLEHEKHQRQIEEQLRQSQKMEALGSLTGGMAHDFNNILSIVIGSLDTALNKSKGEVATLIKEAIEASVSASDLTRSLLAFARQQPLQPRRIQINTLISDIVRLLRRTLSEKIDIRLDLEPNLWPCVVDPVQLESAVANLSTNARDAMPRGGRLVITTANRHLDEHYAELNPEVVPGDYTAIEVSDSGIGMTPEVLLKIFEPFFTTKETGKGTGLGLSMVFGFMKQSNGHISVYSEPDVGTTFRLYFPRVPGEYEIETPELYPHKKVELGKGQIILVVEDNDRLRRIVMTQVHNLGYQPLEASNSKAALEIMAHQKIDVLFTDIVMPGEIDGIGLARRALERWPDVRILLTSGFPGGLKLDEELNNKTVKLLSKPYRTEELAYMLQLVLESPKHCDG